MKMHQLLKKIIVFALVAEGIPIIAQLGFIAIHNLVAQIPLALDDAFMTSRGFFVFQIAGFYLSFLFFYILIVKDRGRHPYGAVWFFLISIAIEFGFYVIAPVSFRFIYIYSFLDKFIAILMASLTYLIYKDAFYRLIFTKR